MRVTAKEARDRFSEILNRAARGEEIVVIRRGRAVARLASAGPKKRPQLPDLREFRASIHVRGPSLTETMAKEREETRY